MDKSLDEIITSTKGSKRGRGGGRGMRGAGGVKRGGGRGMGRQGGGGGFGGRRQPARTSGGGAFNRTPRVSINISKSFVRKKKRFVC